MKALVFALLLASVGVAQAEGLALTPADRAAEEASACKALEATHTAERGAPPLVKLSDLPKGVLQHAVMRLVRGCPVLEVISNGQVVYAPSRPVTTIEGPAVPTPVAKDAR